MVSLRRITWLLCFGLVFSGAIAAQQQSEQLTPTTAALQLSSELDKSSLKYDSAIADIIESYLIEGDYSAAFNSVSALHPTQRVEQLHQIAAVAIKAWKNEEARTALNLALKLLLEDPEDARETGWLKNFAAQANEIGDNALASRFIDAIVEDSPRKTQALLSLGQAHLRKGNKEAAIAALNSALVELKVLQIHHLSEFFKLVPPITTLLVEVGDRERAVELAKLADQTSVPKDDLNQERYKSSRAMAFANVGDFERALAITESQEGEAKGEGIIALGLAYGRTGNSAAALSSIRYAIAQTPDNDNLHKLIVTAYLQLSRPDDAFAVLQQMHDQYVLVESGIKIAEHYNAIDRNQDAVSALDTAFSEVRKMVSEKSLDISSRASFSIAREKSMSLVNLGKAYLQIGHLSGAEKAASAIDQPQYKASLLTLVAASYSKNGNQAKSGTLLRKAFTLSAKADEYKHDKWRAQVFLQIAEAYVDAGSRSEATDVILSLLGELLKDENQHLTISGLSHMGRICVRGGISLDKRAQSMLLEIVKKYREDS